MKKKKDCKVRKRKVDGLKRTSMEFEISYRVFLYFTLWSSIAKYFLSLTSFDKLIRHKKITIIKKRFNDEKKRNMALFVYFAMTL